MKNRSPRVQIPVKNLFWILLLLLSGCGGSETDEVTGTTWKEGLPEKSALAVDAREIVTGRLMPTVEAGGSVEGMNQAVVVSRTQGRIEAIHAEIGDILEAEAPLLEVDDAVADLTLQQAREQMENARITLEAQEKLRGSGGVSQADLLRSRSAFRGAQALYETALKAYDDTTLKSPIGGFLAWKTADLEVGNYLSPGQPIYRVADLSGLRITLSVGERQVGLIKPGAEARITIPAALGTGEIPGRVKAVGAGSDLFTGSYAVIVEAENPYGSVVKAGMTAAVSILTDDPRRGIIIPRSSVVSRQGESFVFLAEEGTAVPKPVRAGESLGNRLLILEGIETGATLITSGLGTLKPGDPVEARIVGTSEEGV